MSYQNQNQNREYKQLPEGKMRRYVHSPFTLNEKETEIKVSEDGKVTIIQNHADDTFEEITIPASLIFKIGNMLKNTRKVHIVDKIDKIEKEVK